MANIIEMKLKKQKIFQFDFAISLKKCFPFHAEILMF